MYRIITLNAASTQVMNNPRGQIVNRSDYHPDCRADYVLATALRDSAFLQSDAKPQVVSAASDNFRKDNSVRWQWSGETWTTEGCRQSEQGGVHPSASRPVTVVIRSR